MQEKHFLFCGKQIMVYNINHFYNLYLQNYNNIHSMKGEVKCLRFIWFVYYSGVDFIW